MRHLIFPARPVTPIKSVLWQLASPEQAKTLLSPSIALRACR
jgi:hypothetical protein